jgi:hypothetical protein
VHGVHGLYGAGHGAIAKFAHKLAQVLPVSTASMRRWCRQGAGVAADAAAVRQPSRRRTAAVAAVAMGKHADAGGREHARLIWPPGNLRSSVPWVNLGSSGHRAAQAWLALDNVVHLTAWKSGHGLDAGYHLVCPSEGVAVLLHRLASQSCCTVNLFLGAARRMPFGG